MTCLPHALPLPDPHPSFLLLSLTPSLSPSLSPSLPPLIPPSPHPSLPPFLPSSLPPSFLLFLLPSFLSTYIISLPQAANSSNKMNPYTPTTHTQCTSGVIPSDSKQYILNTSILSMECIHVCSRVYRAQ